MTKVQVSIDGKIFSRPNQVLELVKEQAEALEAHELAKLADCGVPAKGSPGAELLTGVAEWVIDDWAEQAGFVYDDNKEPKDWGYLAGMIQDIECYGAIGRAQESDTRNGKVPHPTHLIWQAFIDLDAMQEEVNLIREEQGEKPWSEPVKVPAFNDLTEVAIGALGVIIEKLGDALVNQMNEQASNAIEALSNAWDDANEDDEDGEN